MKLENCCSPILRKKADPCCRPPCFPVDGLMGNNCPPSFLPFRSFSLFSCLAVCLSISAPFFFLPFPCCFFVCLNSIFLMSPHCLFLMHLLYATTSYAAPIAAFLGWSTLGFSVILRRQPRPPGRLASPRIQNSSNYVHI